MSTPHKHDVLLSIYDRVSDLMRTTHPNPSNGGTGCCPTCLYRFDPLLTRVEAWAYTGFKPGTLAVWDCQRTYDLQPVKFGNTVRYRLSSLNRFADERIRPTSLQVDDQA